MKDAAWSILIGRKLKGTLKQTTNNRYDRIQMGNRTIFLYYYHL